MAARKGARREAMVKANLAKLNDAILHASADLMSPIAMLFVRYALNQAKDVADGEKLVLLSDRRIAEIVDEAAAHWRKTLVVLQLTPQMSAALDRGLASGLHGVTRADVGERLLARAIRVEGL